MRLVNVDHIDSLSMSVNNASGSSCMSVEPDEAQSDPTVQTSNSTQDTPLSTSISDANINNDAAGEEAQTKHESDQVKPNQGKKRPDCDIEDSLSDREDARRSSLFRESVGESGIPVYSSLRERRAKAPRRLLQAKAYAELVEDRILYLEQTLRDLTKSKDLEKEESTEDKRPPNDIRSLLHVANLGWVEFNHQTLVNPKDITGKWDHRPEVDTGSKPVVEVLVEEPRHSLSLASTNQQNSDEPHKPLSGPDCRPSERDRSGEPYRLRIRSNLLLRTLKEITGINLVIGPHEHRLLMLRPFKFLVHFEAKIKKFISEAENKELIDENTEERAIANQGPIPPRAAGPVTETRSPQALKELKVLYNLIDTHLKGSTELQRGIGPAVRKITFNELWYIFKPGYEIRTPGQSQIQVYRIAKVTGGRDTITFGSPPDNPASVKLKDDGFSEGAFVIECFYIHFDGSRFGPVNKTFQIRKFDDARDINMLPVIPLQCCAAEDEIRKRLLARGKKFTELSGPGTSAHRKYKGLTLDKNPEQVESEVIIDFELAFLQTKINRPSLGLRDELVDDDMREVGDTTVTDHVCREAGCCGNEITFNDYAVDDIERNSFKADYKYLFDDNPEHPDQLTPAHLILLPPHVYGFVLRTRRWATFDIDRLAEIPASEDGWNNLVINEDIKRNVLALVKNHEKPRGSQAMMIDGALSSVDLIPGKGRGLIILLHGEPGVGKTSTAECVAALTGRPLFPITCGDIGDKAETVETNLEKNFQLAHKWGCVLLLDEADIFLSARTAQDIQRNAIVSVFLRTLEYYSGILFLTTNRVGRIDRAFKSRIHLSLLYKKLNKERTVQIWENNISRVQKEFDSEGKKIDLRRLEIINFAKKHYKELRDSDDLIVWNGRQIRNAFQTAIAIAAYDANNDSSGGIEAVPVVGASQFQMVARSARQFDSYLRQVKLHHDTDLAKMEEERDDDFVSTTDEEESRRPKKRSKHGQKASKKRKRNKLYESSEDSDEDSEKSMNDPEDSSKDSDSDDEKRTRVAGKKKTKY